MTRSKTYTKEDLQATTLKVEYLIVNILKAARRWEVPRRTLQHRLASTMSHRDAAEIQIRFTPIQEDYFITWIKQLDREFNNPPHTLIIKMVKKIANIPLGQR